MTPQENRPIFKIQGRATIKHLNIRKEGPEDEKIIAVDVKMEFNGVDRRLCAYFDEALEAFLWRGNTDALIARNAWLGPVQYGHEITGASVEIEGKSFGGCEVKKFAMVAKDGGVMTLTLAVSLYPSSPEVSDLAKLVQDEARVVIEGPPDLFAGAAPAPDGNVVITFGGATRPAQIDFDELAGENDPRLAEARQLVLSTRKGSISLIQRHLMIGYNRAARLLEALEGEGLVSPMQANGTRKVIGVAA